MCAGDEELSAEEGRGEGEGNARVTRLEPLQEACDLYIPSIKGIGVVQPSPG